MFCTTHIEKIRGIEDTGKYVDIVYGRKQNLRVLAVSIFSLAVSTCLLLIKLVELVSGP